MWFLNDFFKKAYWGTQEWKLVKNGMVTTLQCHIDFPTLNRSLQRQQVYAYHFKLVKLMDPPYNNIYINYIIPQENKKCIRMY